MKDYIINENLLTLVIKAVGELKAGADIGGVLVSGIHSALINLPEKAEGKAEDKAED